jgi:hypothetical protein
VGQILGTVPRKARPPLWTRKNAGVRLSNGIYQGNKQWLLILKMGNHRFRSVLRRTFPMSAKIGISQFEVCSLRFVSCV